MFNEGDIVYHDNLYFQNKILDNKKNRPCVVLYEIEIDGINYVCTCPLTSQIKSFNKKPQNYVLIPDIIYNYKKISFANISSVGLREEENTHKTNIPINKTVVSLIKNKIMNSKISELKEIKQQLLQIEKDKEKSTENQKKLSKQLKNEKRRNAKRAN